MYYISMYVTPHWKQPDCRKVKKALAHFWVVAKDSVKASRKAINYLESQQWEVHSLKELGIVVGREDHAHGAIGLVHSYRAQEHGFSACLTDWDMEGSKQPLS